MEFDPSTARPVKEAGEFSPETAQPAVREEQALRSGFLEDPALDQKAYAEAKRRFDERPQFPGNDVIDRFADNFAFNVSRPISGMREAISGDGYEYGKAVDAYYDKFISESSGSAGTAASVGGTVMSPSPVSKVKGPLSLLMKILSDAGIAAGERQGLSTETEDRDFMTDALVGGAGSIGGRALTNFGGGIAKKAMGAGDDAIPEALMGRATQASARGATELSGPDFEKIDSMPTSEQIRRYYEQQGLMGR